MEDQKLAPAHNLAVKLYKVITESEEDQIKYAPDAIIRLYVFITKRDGWTKEEMGENMVKGINLYHNMVK